MSDLGKQMADGIFRAITEPREDLDELRTMLADSEDDLAHWTASAADSERTLALIRQAEQNAREHVQELRGRIARAEAHRG